MVGHMLGGKGMGACYGNNPLHDLQIEDGSISKIG